MNITINDDSSVDIYYKPGLEELIPEWGAKPGKLGTNLAQLIYKKFVEAMPYLRNFKYLLTQKKKLLQFREILGN